MKKSIVLYLGLIMASILFLVSCNQPMSVENIDSVTDEEQIELTGNEAAEINETTDTDSRFVHKILMNPLHMIRYPGSGIANGLTWYKVDGRWGDNYYMRAVYQNKTASPHVAVTSNFESISPKLVKSQYFVADKVYYVWILGYGRSGEENSVHVGLNKSDDNVTYSYGDYLVHNKWNDGEWTWSSTRNNGNRARFKVSKTGTYYFNVWMRENGFRVGDIIITTDSSYHPHDDIIIVK